MMETASLGFMLVGILCVILTSILFVAIVVPSDTEESFGIAVCKRSEDRWMGKYYIMEYFLTDQNGNTLQIDKNIFDALALQECKR